MFGADPSEVFAYQGGVVLTQQELDAAFSAIPEAQRLAFIRDGGKVDQLVKTLLRRKSVAADAERADYQEEPLVADRVKLAAQKELAEAWLEHVVRTAPEADFEALAREEHREVTRALASLDLRATPVTDLTVLADMAALQRAVLQRLDVERAAIDRLHEARPDIELIT